MLMNKINKKPSLSNLMTYITFTYVKNGLAMDVKFEPDSSNGWAVCGNDWSNALKGLHFSITKYELIKDGWKKQ